MITRSSKLRLIRWSVRSFWPFGFFFGVCFGVVLMLGVIRVCGWA